MRTFAPILFALLFAAPVARAGALDRFEDAHKKKPSPPPPSSPSEPSSSESSSSEGSSTTASIGTSSGSGETVLPPELLIAFVPAIWGAVLAPPNRPTIDPYDGTWVSPGHADAEGNYGEHPPESRLRHLEATIGGFVAPGDYVYSRTFGLRLFLGKMVATGSWDRMYESPPEPEALSRLDFYRFHLSSNLFGGWVRNVELYPQMGAALMQGRRSTWAFDGGLEARIYPQRPIALSVSSIASIFAEGPVLFDTRVEAGLVYDRLEIRGGLRWLYQYQAQGFIGPIASMIVRL